MLLFFKKLRKKYIRAVYDMQLIFVQSYMYIMVR